MERIWRRLATLRRSARFYCSERAAVGPLKQYEELVARGILQHDPQQQRVAATLDILFDNLKIHQKNLEYYNIELQSWKRARHELRQQMLEEEAEEEARRKTEQSKDWRESMRKLFSRAGNKREIESGSGKMVARIKREKTLDAFVGPRPVPPPAPQGIYLYGNVGSGKTLLMDMLFGCSKGVVRYRRRMHFHAAMLELHERMHKIWKHEASKAANSSRTDIEEAVDDDTDLKDDKGLVSPIFDKVAEEFLEDMDFQGASLLCFDEVQVVDPFTAVALAGVLGKLLQKGVVLVATSNRPFTDLNKDGMQKEVFMKFIEQLKKHCHPVFVGDEIDYRRVLASTYDKEQRKNYLWPLNSQTEEHLSRKWDEMTAQGPVGSSQVRVMFGRILEVPEGCNGIARFTFEQLCDQPIGSPDYIALAQQYHTVFVTGIPVMSRKIRDKARRFITLVDELYNHHCQLICTAAAPPDELFLGTDEGSLIDLEGLQFETEAESGKLRTNVLVSGNVAPVQGTKNVEKALSGYEEMFAFHRAASRLIEMQAPSYLEKVRTHPKY